MTEHGPLDSLLGSCAVEGTGPSFMCALRDLIASPGGRPGVGLPDHVRSVLELYALWSDIGAEGMWKYLEEWGVGADFDQIREWCRRIGALTTVDYLDATGAVFPGGRVIVDDEERRRFVDRLGFRVPDPLRQCDDKYREVAVKEIPTRLHAYLSSHHDELAAWLARAPSDD